MKNYPLWKLILILTLVSLSFIFTIPSLIYQEEPDNWFLDNKINLGLDLKEAPIYYLKLIQVFLLMKN